MRNTRALNVWFALSDCGVDAPGLDFVPARIDELVETGTEGSGAEHLDRPEDDSVTAKTVLVAPNSAEAAAGEKGVQRPEFSAGDLMLFDDLFLHRTGSEPEMTEARATRSSAGSSAPPASPGTTRRWRSRRSRLSR